MTDLPTTQTTTDDAPRRHRAPVPGASPVPGE